MRRAIALTAFALLLGVFPVRAQEQSRRALAEELMNVTDARAMFDKNISLLKQTMQNQTAQITGQQNAASDKTFELFSKYLTWDKIKDDFISVYAEIFTEDEMKGIIDFYKTPSGQALLKKQPQLLQRTLETSQKWIEDIMPKIMKELSSQPAK